MKSPYYKRTVDGNWTNKPPVGYCTYRWHRGALTKNLLATKGCLVKHCKHFRKDKDHPIWHEGAYKWKKKKMKRRKQKLFYC